MILIPMTNQPNRSFRMRLPYGNKNILLDFFTFWNRQAGYWELTLGDTVTGTTLIYSLPLVAGADPAQNLLAQYEYMQAGKLYVVPLDGIGADPPGVDSWGSTYFLFWEE